MRDIVTGETCGGFELRRLHAGEIGDPRATALRAHVATCERCTRTWAALDAGQAELEAALPFADFEAGVKRRMARARAESAAPARRRGWVARVVPLAAAASVAVTASVVLLRRAPDPYDGIKGGAGEARVTLLVGDERRHHAAASGEQLAPGERVRIEILPASEQRYGLALSIDAAGQVTPLYDEAGRSLPLQPGRSQLLPDSLEFDGPGAERVYVILSSEPLATEGLVRRAAEAFRAAGSVEAMELLPGVPAEDQETVLLHKP